MNERFRVRAWSKVARRYFHDIILSNVGHELYLFDSTDVVPHAHVVLEQCTGCKDKRGRYIYEGDIVVYEGDLKQIEWYEGGFFVTGFRGGKKIHLRLVHSRAEVVGNLHENPDLVKRGISAL